MDLETIRNDTPGVDHVVHLAACGAALMPRQVVSAVADHLALEAEIGGYEAHASREEELDGVYDTIAAMVNARRTEIAILQSASAAWCSAFYSLPFRPGDRVLTCEAEYAANYVALLQRARRDGIRIDVVPSDASGQIDTAALEEMIDDRVVLIAITWIPTNGGLVNPAEAVGGIARRHRILYLLDACQAVGQMPVDVRQIGCDFLAATGRKFLRGPRGTGFLYVREALLDYLEPAMIDHFAAPWVATDRYELRPDARRFEMWESSYALRAGLGAAARYAMDVGLEAIRSRSWQLAAALRERLSALPGVRVMDIGDTRCAIVSFSIDGHDRPRETVRRLRAEGIAIGATDPPTTRLDAERRNLPVMFRAAPHYYNTEAELDRLTDAIAALR